MYSGARGRGGEECCDEYITCRRRRLEYVGGVVGQPGDLPDGGGQPPRVLEDAARGHQAQVDAVELVDAQLVRGELREVRLGQLPVGLRDFIFQCNVFFFLSLLSLLCMGV